jgi:type VI secretion system secreted protein VgrG
VSSAKSFLASALDSIRLFAQKAGIRIFAGQGPVQVQAQDDRIELIAHRVLELISTTDWVKLKGKEGISFEVGHSSFKITSDGFRFYTPGAHHAWAGSHQTFGPKTLSSALPELPTSVCIPCLLKAAKAGSAITRF